MPSISLTNLFAKLGRCVYWFNDLVNYQNVLYLSPSTGEADDVLSQFNDRRDLVPSFESTVLGQANQMASQAAVLKSLSDAVLSDLQLDLNCPSNRPGAIIPLLANYMTANGATVLQNTIANPTITPSGGNNGNGVLVCSNLSPLGVTDQRIQTEVVQLVCTNSQWSGGTAGSERFAITGWPTAQPQNYGLYGNGNGPTLQIQGTGGIIGNGGFETWSVANTPNNWTVNNGTVGTNILQNTVHPHAGLSALELAGDGSTTTINLSQVVAGSINSLAVYAACVWIRISGTVTSGSNLAITIQGTGATTTTLFNADPSTLTTTYQLFTVFFAASRTLGNGVPANYSMVINWTSANAAGASAVILIDDIILQQSVTFGYTQYFLTRGSTDFAVGDNFNVNTTVSTSGAFQTYFAKLYQALLPSSASPSIPDTLATSLP